MERREYYTNPSVGQIKHCTTQPDSSQHCAISSRHGQISCGFKDGKTQFDGQV